MLPNFLNLGVPRAGTTWLHELLASHPDVFVPSSRKEIHFFVNEYHRGLEWYARHFPSEQEASRYLAVGEVGTHYLGCEACPERIAEMGTARRFIVMLRDPVERTISHYRWLTRGQSNPPGLFEMAERRPILERSIYTPSLRNYLGHFDRKQFLILFYEEVFEDVPAARSRIANFLGVDEQRFPAGAGEDVVNAGFRSRFPRIYGRLNRAASWFRARHLDTVPNLGKRLGLKRLMAASPGAADVTAVGKTTRQALHRRFASDAAELKELLGCEHLPWTGYGP